MRFKNRVVVVTGGASGMGAAAANMFHDCGASVYVLDIQAGEGLSDEIKVITCDVSIFEQVKTAVGEIIKKAGRIDHLFTNAGILLSDKLVDSELDDIESVINVNLKGVIYTLKTILPVMVENKYGSIVIMGSDQSLIGKLNNTIYGCTKAAVAQLSKSLAVEYSEDNIRVNCVCPGTIDTPFFRRAIKSFSDKTGTPIQDIIDEVSNAQPIKRLGTADEVASLVSFLCSDSASYITGAVFSIDGGYTAQ